MLLDDLRFDPLTIREIDGETESSCRALPGLTASIEQYSLDGKHLRTVVLSPNSVMYLWPSSSRQI